MAIRPRAPDRTTDALAEAGVAAATLRAEDGEGRGFAARAAVHGGRLVAAMAAYPHAPRPWLDLSTGINPEPWRGPRARFDALARLPDPMQLARLEAVAAEAFGVTDPARVLAVAGAEAGLRLLPQVLQVDALDVVSPTYSGHEAAWRAAGATVREIAAEDASASPAPALVLVNPNNPDGRAWDRDSLSALVGRRTQRGLWTIVDESFVETSPALSIADLHCDRLVVLRSFGKFYGLPGLRLGFVVASPELVERLRGRQGEWPVSAEAIVMGAGAYADRPWRSRVEARLRRRAERLDQLLMRRGLSVVGGTSLFRLAATKDADAVFGGLCRAGVLTRPFAHRNDWLRFGVPRHADFARLDAALLEVAQ